MIRCFLILLFVGMCQTAARAQLVYTLDDDAAYVAAMEKQVLAATNDSSRCHLYLKLSALYRLVNDTAKARLARNNGVALSAPFPFLRAIAHYYRAQALYASMNIPAIEALLLKSDSLLANARTLPAFEIRAYIWHAYGTLQQVKGNESAAMDAFVNRALPAAEASHNPFLTGNVKKALAIVLMNANQRTKAAVYLRQAMLELKRSPADNPIRLETLAETYITAAENYALLDSTANAAEALRQARAILSRQPRSNLFLNYYFAEGSYLDKTGRYGDAVHSIRKGLDMAQQAGSSLWMNRLRHALYKSLLHAARYSEAIAELEQLVVAKGVFASDKKIYYKDLYTAYALTGAIEKAYVWADRYSRLSDSLYDSDFQKGVVDLEKKYHDAEDSRKILELQSEQRAAHLQAANHRLLIYLLGGALLTLASLLVLVVLLYRNSKKLARQSQQIHAQQLHELRQEQKLSQARALVQGSERERGRLARDLHDGLGGVLAAVKMNLSVLAGRLPGGAPLDELTRAIGQLDRAVDELRRIARNMMPESLENAGLETAVADLCAAYPEQLPAIRFQAIGLSNHLNSDVRVVVYRIVQELLANAVRHASAQQVLVQISQNGPRVYLTVEDDGKGFNENERPAGMGLHNVRSRVDYLNGRLEVISNAGSGTTVNVEFDVD